MIGMRTITHSFTRTVGSKIDKLFIPAMEAINGYGWCTVEISVNRQMLRNTHHQQRTHTTHIKDETNFLLYRSIVDAAPGGYVMRCEWKGQKTVKCDNKEEEWLASYNKRNFQSFFFFFTFATSTHHLNHFYKNAK